jgi:hypothetical protein
MKPSCSRVAHRHLTARVFRVWQNSTEGVHDLAKAISKEIKRDDDVVKVQLGKASDYNRLVHIWTYDPSDRASKETVARIMDVASRKLGLRKGASYGWFGDGISVIEDNDLNARDNKQTLIVSVSIENGSEEEYEAALAKGFGRR